MQRYGNYLAFLNLCFSKILFLRIYNFIYQCKNYENAPKVLGSTNLNRANSSSPIPTQGSSFFYNFGVLFAFISVLFH